MKHCLVTGASGFVGQKMCAQLKKHNVQIRALFRNPAQGFWDEMVLSDFSNLTQKPLPADLMQGIDTVFHLAGINHALATYDQYQAVNVAATQKILALAAASNVKRFVYFSSVKAIVPNDEYGRSKQKAEQLVLEFGAKHNIHVTVLRPSMVYGLGMKGSLLLMIRSIDKGTFLPVPMTEKGGSMIGVDDLVRIAYDAALKAEANGKIYTVTDGVSYPTRKLYDAVRASLGLSKRTWAIPEGLLRGVLCKILNKTMLYKRLMEPVSFSNEMICKELGFVPEQTVFDVLQNIVNQYIIVNKIKN